MDWLTELSVLNISIDIQPCYWDNGRVESPVAYYHIIWGVTTTETNNNQLPPVSTSLVPGPGDRQIDINW